MAPTTIRDNGESNGPLAIPSRGGVVVVAQWKDRRQDIRRSLAGDSDLLPPQGEFRDQLLEIWEKKFKVCARRLGSGGCGPRAMGATIEGIAGSLLRSYTVALFEFIEGNPCFTPDRLRVPPHNHLNQSDLTGCRAGHSEGLRLRDGRREEQIAGLRIARRRTTDRGPRRTAAFPLPPLLLQAPTVPAWRGCSVLVALRSHWISRDSSEFHRLWNSLSTAWISLLTPTKRAFRK